MTPIDTYHRARAVLGSIGTLVVVFLVFVPNWPNTMLTLGLMVAFSAHAWFAAWKKSYPVVATLVIDGAMLAYSAAMIGRMPYTLVALTSALILAAILVPMNQLKLLLGAVATLFVVVATYVPVAALEGSHQEFAELVAMIMLAVALVSQVTMLVLALRRSDEQHAAMLSHHRRFVASITHELRSPLSGVVGLANELRDHADLFNATEVANLHSLIASQANDTSAILEDLLIAARTAIEEIQVEEQRVNAEETVQHVLRQLSISDVDVASLAEDVVVLADPVRVRQILRNLLTNAERYGGPRVVVSARRGRGVHILSVKDDGIGIPTERRLEIFEPFGRSDDSDTPVASVGLGLTVSRTLARLMGGDLTYSYNAGWSSFDLSLPSAVATQPVSLDH